MLSIIVAAAQNNVIGNQNKLIWHISEDLQYFKKLTLEHVVIMGRKTFESIGRPLPKRCNIVISGNVSYRTEGCIVARSLDEATAFAKSYNSGEAFIIGGGSIYREAINLVDKVYLTRIHKDYEGDVYFPELNAEQWDMIECRDFDRGEKFEYPFSFIVYKRKTAD
jgi:dihydrofolate reductase